MRDILGEFTDGVNQAAVDYNVKADVVVRRGWDFKRYVGVYVKVYSKILPYNDLLTLSRGMVYAEGYFIVSQLVKGTD